MLPASTRLMSADDHLIEPPHLWVDRVPAQVPRRLPAHRRDRRSPGVVYEGEITYIPMGSCRRCRGTTRRAIPPAPGTARFDEIRPGCYDPVER